MDLEQFKTLVKTERERFSHEGHYADRFFQARIAERIISIEEKLDAILKLQMHQIVNT